MFSTRIGLWLVLFSFAAGIQPGLAQQRPNIIFLMADDQCTYSLGCYDTPGVQTPHLDQLARDGMVFDNHYVTTAICMASRATVMTGMYEYKTGCNFQHGNLLQTHWEFGYPYVLRQAGYQTAFAGKFGFVVAELPDGKGVLPEYDFDFWGGGPGQTSYETARNESIASYADQYPHSTLAYAAFSSDFIRSAARSEAPFCLSVSFKAPHRPTIPDSRFDHVYADTSFARPVNFGREHGEHFSLQSRQGRQYERFHSWHYSDRYESVMRTYHQQVYAIDVAVGMIREALRENGVDDNTVIIYTSDNGFMCGAHGYGSKVLPYEESSRVPLIMYDPRSRSSGQQVRCQALTGNIDFAPTLLDLAGVRTPNFVDGVSLMQLYEDPGSTIHQSLTLINVWGPSPTHSLAVVTTDWKFIYWPYEEDEFEPATEMYDLNNDPWELNNLAMDTATSAQLESMQTLYDQAVAHWQENAVPYHNYAPFGQWFARNHSSD